MSEDGTPKRAYRSDRRREQAQETRRRMLRAAGRLLAERGYAGTTLATVALSDALQNVYAFLQKKAEN